MKPRSHQITGPKHQQAGSTFVEYLLVVTLLGFIFVGTVLTFQPKSEEFNQRETGGLFNPYPEGFLQ